MLISNTKEQLRSHLYLLIFINSFSWDNSGLKNLEKSSSGVGWCLESPSLYHTRTGRETLYTILDLSRTNCPYAQCRNVLPYPNLRNAISHMENQRNVAPYNLNFHHHIPKLQKFVIITKTTTQTSIKQSQSIIITRSGGTLRIPTISLYPYTQRRLSSDTDLLLHLRRYLITTQNKESCISASENDPQLPILGNREPIFVAS